MDLLTILIGDNGALRGSSIRSEHDTVLRRKGMRKKPAAKGREERK